jgi:hypothetical protein
MKTKNTITSDSFFEIISYLNKLNEATEDMVDEPELNEAACSVGRHATGLS